MATHVVSRMEPEHNCENAQVTQRATLSNDLSGNRNVATVFGNGQRVSRRHQKGIRERSNRVYRCHEEALKDP